MRNNRSIMFVLVALCCTALQPFLRLIRLFCIFDGAKTQKIHLPLPGKAWMRVLPSPYFSTDNAVKSLSTPKISPSTKKDCRKLSLAAAKKVT